MAYISVKYKNKNCIFIIESTFIEPIRGKVRNIFILTHHNMSLANLAIIIAFITIGVLGSS